MALPINIQELHLTEGRCTGFPTIRGTLANNGSPEPTFKTDDDRTSFLLVLPVHPVFRLSVKTPIASGAQVEAQVTIAGEVAGEVDPIRKGIFG